MKTKPRYLSHISLAALLAPFFLYDGGGDGGGTGGGGAATPTVESLQAQLAALQGQIGTLTTERDDYKTKADAAADKEKTDSERLTDGKAAAERERDEAKQRAQDLQVQIAVERAARKLNIADEDVALKLLDVKAIKFDKDGKPENVETLLTDLVKAKPYLVKAEESSTARGGSSSSPARTRTGERPKSLAEAIKAAEKGNK